MQPFYDLSVAIPNEKKGLSSSLRRSFGKKELNSNPTSLEDCLAAHTRSETLSDSMAVMCSTCKKKRKSLKRITLDR